MATCLNYDDDEEESESYSDSDASEYSDDSDSRLSGSSSSSYEDYEPIWTDKVKPNGDLFYFESTQSEETEPSPSTVNAEKSTNISKEQSTEAKSKAAGKIAQWMKHRQKKLKKHFIRKKKSSATQGNQPVPTIMSLPFSQIGEEKEVFLDVDINRYNYGRRASLAERLFGLIIVPFQSLESSGNQNDDERLIVKEIIPYNESYREGTIQIGDWLKSVDDKLVTVSNFHSVLEALASPKQVKLVIHRFPDKNISSKEATKDPSPGSSLFDHLLSHQKSLEKTKYSSLPYVAYYLSIVSDSSAQEDNDVVYCYPDDKNILLTIKGMCITLTHMIADVATPPVLTCNIMVQEEMVGLSFLVDGDHMMIIALPSAFCTTVELQLFATVIGKILKLQFQSLSHAFCDKNNQDYLDCFFTHFFHQILNSVVDGKAKSHLLSILPSIHWFPLPCDIKIVVDDILSQFESADFSDDSEGFYGNRRIYNILGSCLFHKGYLLGSHLYKNDLLDVGLFLQYHGLLALSSGHRMSRAIVWREIYPSRKQNKPPPEDPNFVEVDGRYFLLIVAMKNNIIATILEAGGCALSASGYPPPEPFYVELVEGTLALMEESGIFSAIGKLLEAQLPPLAHPDQFLKPVERSGWERLTSIVGLNISNQQSGRSLDKRAQSSSNLSSDGSRKLADTLSILKKTQYGDGDFERQQLLSNMGPADGESDEESNCAPDWSSSGQRHGRRYSTSTSSNTGSHCSEENIHLQANSAKSRYISSYDVRASQDHLDTTVMSDSVIEETQLVTGPQNTLFYYLHMDPAEGVFLAPTTQAQKIVNGTLGQDIMQNFYKCCLQMRTTFECSLRNKQLLDASASPKFGLNGFLQAAYEQGALFQLHTTRGESSKKSAVVLKFWVIGRLFFAPEPREVYVCYHDSLPQNVVEMAFRLGFGLLL